VLRIQAAVAAAFGPDDHVVVTVGALHCGTRGNIVAEDAALEVSVRAPGPAAVQRAAQVVRRAADVESAAHGCPRGPDVEVRAAVPATVCDPGTTAAVRQAHRAALGPERATVWPPSSATEDFALFGDAGLDLHGVPGVRIGYWMLGAVGPRQWAQAPGDSAAAKLAALPANHSPYFRPDVRLTTPAGLTALTTAALSRLAPPEQPH